MRTVISPFIILLVFFFGHISYAQILCDDFTTGPWDQGIQYSSGDTIGFTQDSSQPVILTFGSLSLNNWFPGIYFVNEIVKFNFDGSIEVAQFEIYASLNQFDQMGFSVNDSPLEYMDASFPLMLGNVQVDLDTSAQNFDGFVNSYLTFTGDIDSVFIQGFESGILSLCTDLNTSTYSQTYHSGTVVYPNPADQFIRVESEEAINGLRLYSASGALVSQEILGSVRHAMMEVHSPEPGFYLLAVDFNNGAREVQKIVVH